jgi:hypothetical protein
MMIIQKKSSTPFYFVLTALLVFILGINTITAQTGKQQINFSSITEAGLVIGDKGEALALQTINGIRKVKWFAGVGVGFDFYGQRTIPLFINYRRDFTDNRNTPFIYTSGGLNFAWINATQKTQLGIVQSSPGYYYDIGAGWKMAGKNGRAFLISMGYTLKQVKYETPYYTIFAPPQPGEEMYNRYNYLFRRIVVKIGFQL